MKVKHQNFLRQKPPECQHFLNMQIQTSHSTLNLGLTVDRLLEELEAQFPPFTPHPKEELNTIMYQAGQRSIVEWIKKRINDEELS